MRNAFMGYGPPVDRQHNHLTARHCTRAQGISPGRLMMQWRRKAAAIERGAWAAGGEAGVEAIGEACVSCGWRAAMERAGWRR